MFYSRHNISPLKNNISTLVAMFIIASISTFVNILLLNNTKTSDFSKKAGGIIHHLFCFYPKTNCFLRWAVVIIQDC